MSDLEKWTNFLDEMDIKYEIQPSTTISVLLVHVRPYSTALLYFNRNGSFKRE